MKKIRTQDAVGLALCHDITAMRDGFKGAAFRRGHIITSADVEQLLDLGKRTVFVWEDQAGELHEEDCARRLGADIVTHGVPAQPGNMTLVAYLGTVAILGVPGAAISLPTTIFDVLLPQIFAGQPFTKQELIRLEDGGLCQQCKTCHFPNCTFGRY